MHMDLKKACSILVVESNASLVVITKAYKKLALKYHPDKCKDENAQEKFTEIQKAFNYLKTALPKKDKTTKNTSNKQEQESPQQPQPNEFKITLTLEEIFEGCTRKAKITIKVVDSNGVEKKESKQLTVNVKRGSIEGTRIVVEKEGDRYHGKIPANVVFIVYEHPHQLFKRARFDLVYTAMLTTEQACAKHVTVPAIDGRQIRLPIKELITQSTERREPNLGLPIPTGNGKRGDLVIKFDILYEKDKKKDPPVKYDLLLTLEEILKGCIKKMKINCTVTDPFDGIELKREKILELEVLPGADSGTQFIFVKEGDQRPKTIPADIIFTVRQKTHSKFIRSEADIKHTVLVSEDEVRKGTFTVDVPTLDGDTIPLVIDAGMNSKVFPNRGLPLKDNVNKRGNLIVNVKVLDQSFVDEPIEHDLPLTLEDILHGCVKKRKIYRLIVDIDNNETFEDKVIILEIKPGMESGAKFVYSRMGDKYPGRIPADIVFVTCDKPHDKFVRIGADIEYTAKITQSQLLDKFGIPTLDGDTLTISSESIADQNSVQNSIKEFQIKIPGRGLPNPDDSTKRGKLIVRLKIEEYQAARKQDPPIEHDLYLTDDQMRNGLNKRLKIERLIIEPDGSERNESKILSIDVKPGTELGQQFLFEKVGDIRPGIIPSDIIFIVKRRVWTKKEHNPKTDNQFDELLQDPHIESNLQLTRENIWNGFTSSNVIIEDQSDLKQGPPIQHDLYLTDDQMQKGLKKLFKIDRLIIESNGIERNESKIFSIMVKPGAVEGQKFIFEREGHIQPGIIPSDIIFVVKRKVVPKKKKENNSKRDNRIPKQDPTIERELQLTLENILNGCTKKLKIIRNIIDSDGIQTTKEEIIEIKVEPGTKTGERFTFERKGDKNPGSIPADIVFIAKDKPHDTFTRNGVNIEYVARLSKNMRFNLLNIPTLEGEDISLMVKDSNQDVIILPGHGLPYPGEVSKRGDLVVRVIKSKEQFIDDFFNEYLEKNQNN